MFFQKKKEKETSKILDWFIRFQSGFGYIVTISVILYFLLRPQIQIENSNLNVASKAYQDQSLLYANDEAAANLQNKILELQRDLQLARQSQLNSQDDEYEIYETRELKASTWSLPFRIVFKIYDTIRAIFTFFFGERKANTKAKWFHFFGKPAPSNTNMKTKPLKSTYTNTFTRVLLDYIPKIMLARPNYEYAPKDEDLEGEAKTKINVKKIADSVKTFSDYFLVSDAPKSILSIEIEDLLTQVFQMNCPDRLEKLYRAIILSGQVLKKTLFYEDSQPIPADSNSHVSEVMNKLNAVKTAIVKNFLITDEETDADFSFLKDLTESLNFDVPSLAKGAVEKILIPDTSSKKKVSKSSHSEIIKAVGAGLNHILASNDKQDTSLVDFEQSVKYLQNAGSSIKESIIDAFESDSETTSGNSAYDNSLETTIQSATELGSRIVNNIAENYFELDENHPKSNSKPLFTIADLTKIVSKSISSLIEEALVENSNIPNQRQSKKRSSVIDFVSGAASNILVEDASYPAVPMELNLPSTEKIIDYATNLFKDGITNVFETQETLKSEVQNPENNIQTSIKYLNKLVDELGEHISKNYLVVASDNKFNSESSIEVLNDAKKLSEKLKTYLQESISNIIISPEIQGHPHQLAGILASILEKPQDLAKYILATSDKEKNPLEWPNYDYSSITENAKSTVSDVFIQDPAVVDEIPEEKSALFKEIADIGNEIYESIFETDETIAPPKIISERVNDPSPISIAKAKKKVKMLLDIYDDIDESTASHKALKDSLLNLMLSEIDLVTKSRSKDADSSSLNLDSLISFPGEIFDRITDTILADQKISTSKPSPYSTLVKKMSESLQKEFLLNSSDAPKNQEIHSLKDVAENLVSTVRNLLNEVIVENPIKNQNEPENINKADWGSGIKNMFNYILVE